MNNYQLYRTNVTLGGQLKWNISVDNGPDGLFVSDFHVVPISERVPFNRYAHDNLLNYSHLENIKSFYKQIEGSFYLSYANPLLISDQPYISDEDDRAKLMDLHDDTFDMGAKRARYSIYGKEVEIFCPVWLEDMALVNGWKPLSFVFDVKNKSGMVLCSKTLNISPGGGTGIEFHDKFVNYLYQYINDIKLDDHLIHIDLDDDTAAITGIDASSGLLKTISINKLTQDLTDKERLLMDADSMIIDQYPNNNMIAKQLFNFNFLFNTEDFFPPVIMNMLNGNQVILDVRVKVDDEELKIKDFYTNYDDIPSVCVHGHSDININILDELKDNKDIDLQDKNKVTQRICHWSIIGDDEYIFNVYPGFGGFYVDDAENPHKIGQLYQNTPNIWLDKYSRDTNTIGWANQYEITSVEQYIRITTYYDDLKDLASNLRNSWVNHVKYNHQSENDWYVLLMPCSKNVWSTVGGDMEAKYHANPKGPYFVYPGDGSKPIIYAIWFGSVNLLCFLYEKDNYTLMGNLSFGGLSALINKLNGDNGEIDDDSPHKTWISELHSWMSSVVSPTMITLRGKLGYMFTKGLPGTEVEHYGTVENAKVIRMGGYIRPSFVDIALNNIYTKISISEDEYDNESVFPIYHKTGYPPKYPSLGYYPWEMHGLQHPDNNDRDVKQVLDESKLPYEHHWFTSSNLYMLKPELDFSLCLTDEQDVKTAIREHIQHLYNVNESESYYIFNLYDWKSDWEYANLHDIHTYNYKIKMKLK